MNSQYEFKQLNGPLYKSNCTLYEPTFVEYTETAEQVVIETPNSSDEPDVHSENAANGESASSQPHTPSIEEQSQPSSCRTSGAYVRDTSVDCSGSGPLVPATIVDLDTVDLPDDILENNLSEDRWSPPPIYSSELACATGNSKNPVVISDIGTRESPGYHSQRAHQFHSDMEPDSTKLCVNDVIDQEFLEAFREGVGGSIYPTSGSGHSTNTSGRGYIDLPSSNHLGTED